MLRPDSDSSWIAPRRRAKSTSDPRVFPLNPRDSRPRSPRSIPISGTIGPEGVRIWTAGQDEVHGKPLSLAMKLDRSPGHPVRFAVLVVPGERELSCRRERGASVRAPVQRLGWPNGEGTQTPVDSRLSAWAERYPEMSASDFSFAGNSAESAPFVPSMPTMEPELAPVDGPTEQPQVLLLEDDRMQLSLLARHLEACGLRAIMCTRVSDAARQLQDNKIALAVLDVHLPDGSGIDLCNQIDDHPKLAGTPVIVLSSDDGADIVRRTRAAGGKYFLSKPYDPAVLLTLVEAILKEA
ncbi:MAG: response regulator [Planctomycetota bacterium]|nr:MAG: response regulator [Planctomycetota bacterium]